MLRNAVKVCTVWALVALAMLSGRVCFAAAGTGYWHTSGSTILDSNNQPVRIAGINWYGFETGDEVVHGLTSQDYKAILDTIKANGYNTIRLPYSNQMVETPIVPGAIHFTGASGAINTDLQGLNSLEIMDAVIDYAGSIGLRVILDNHRSEAGNSAESNGLWYTDAYPETAWINDWKALVTRYQNNTTVIGVDLRNEPHNAATGGACWDCGTTNDWHLAAERAGNAVLGINPKLLVFVEGTDEYNNNYYFWGGNLQGVQTSPVQLTVANQLVYSAHDYGPLEFQQPWFNGSTSYDSLVATWTSNWAYISLNGMAPVWVGEFGTLNDAADIQGTTPGSQGQWFSSLVQFLTANNSLSWTYWALNGEDRYALLDSSYGATPASALKQQLLASIQFPLSGGTAPTTQSFTLAQNPSTVIAATSNTDLGGSGDTTEVTYTAVVNNRTTSAAGSVSITLAVPAAAVTVSQASTGPAAACSSGASGYTCNFTSIPSSSSGGVTLTAIYPAANLTFNSSGQASEVVNATADVGSQPLTPGTVTTTVDQQGRQQNTSESVVATASPGYSYAYGQQAMVNFSLAPTPTSPIPLSSFSAQLDGTQNLTITSVGSNQYQIPVGLLSGGTHAIVIHLAGNSSYAASSATVSLAVQKANVTASVAGSPVTGTYGASVPVVLNLTGLSGTGFAAPGGSVSLVIDSLAPQTAAVSGGVASFHAPANLFSGTHSLNFNYAGDANYAAQFAGGTLQIKQAALVATALPATRAFGLANPAFTGTLTGVVSGDGITANYESQATATTPAGTYSTGPNAIAPVLLDPNNRLSNYAATLNDATLTITGAGTTTGDITWQPPAAIDYGTPLGPNQLDATAVKPGVFTYTPPAGTVLGAGPQTLSVSFLPTGSSTAETAKQTLTVNQATTTTTLTAVNAANSTVTLAAVVTSMNGGAVTGSLQFLDGSTALSSVAINSTGQATYTVTLSEGSHTLTAAYSGDINNKASTSTAVLQTVSGSLAFTLTSNPTKLSLSPGQSSPVTLSVVSTGGLSGMVSFTCTGLPTGSTCSFQPATITATGASTAQSTTLTIGLPSGSASLVPADDGSNRYLAGFFVLPGVLLGLGIWWQRRRLGSSLGIWIVASVFLLTFGIGCGANTAVTGAGTSSTGSYNALITATSASDVEKLTIPVTLLTK